MVQEGDGNYITSEPPNANATIARFVVIGGTPPATPPNWITSSKSYSLYNRPASAALMKCRPYNQGCAGSPESSTMLSVRLISKLRGPSEVCMHASASQCHQQHASAAQF